LKFGEGRRSGASPPTFGPYRCGMRRPTRFEEHKYLGDKRTQHVYDVDEVVDSTVIDEIVARNLALAFAPDTLAEARNRGYRLRRA
jgi:hypothetical protein